MTEDKILEAGVDPSRCLNRARAALREAAECLEDAAAASGHSNLSTASALSHVVAARKAIGPFGLGDDRDASERDAA